METIYRAEEINEISIAIGAASVSIQPSEQDGEIRAVLVKGKEEDYRAEQIGSRLAISYELKGKQYVIKGKNELDEVLIYLPQNLHLTRMDLSIGAGEAQMQVPGFLADKIKLEAGAGELDVNDITAAESLHVTVGAGETKLRQMSAQNIMIECGVGNCSYEGSLEHNMDVHCGVGKVKIKLNAKESDYNYRASCALGKVKMNKNTIASLAKNRSIQHANAKGNIVLECGLGNISLNCLE